jgi:hypothetical protein
MNVAFSLFQWKDYTGFEFYSGSKKDNSTPTMIVANDSISNHTMIDSNDSNSTVDEPYNRQQRHLY